MAFFILKDIQTGDIVDCVDAADPIIAAQMIDFKADKPGRQYVYSPSLKPEIGYEIFRSAPYNPNIVIDFRKPVPTSPQGLGFIYWK